MCHQKKTHIQNVLPPRIGPGSRSLQCVTCRPIFPRSGDRLLEKYVAAARERLRRTTQPTDWRDAQLHRGRRIPPRPPSWGPAGHRRVRGMYSHCYPQGDRHPLRGIFRKLSERLRCPFYLGVWAAGCIPSLCWLSEPSGKPCRSTSGVRDEEEESGRPPTAAPELTQRAPPPTAGGMVASSVASLPICHSAPVCLFVYTGDTMGATVLPIHHL